MILAFKSAFSAAQHLLGQKNAGRCYNIYYSAVLNGFKHKFSIMKKKCILNISDELRMTAQNRKKINEIETDVPIRRGARLLQKFSCFHSYRACKGLYTCIS